jgi:hypothetical protein
MSTTKNELSLPDSRQCCGIEHRADKELQADKVVGQTILSVKCQQISSGLAQRRREVRI